MTETALPVPIEARRRLLSVAWVATLLVSNLPDILWREVTGRDASWVFWPKIALLAILLAASLYWKEIRPLRPYLFVFLVLYLVEQASTVIAQAPLWKERFNSTAFTIQMLGNQLLRFGVAWVMALTLYILKWRRADFYFVKGQLDAPVKPVPWLGMDKPESWKRFGKILSIAISLGTLAFLVITGRPSLEVLLKSLVYLPAVVVFAAMNAFSEEMSYRCTLLSTSQPVVGDDQALLLSAAFFGIGHFYGVPYGLIGVLMAGLLGWLLGKSMLETHGFAWAWFIHFLQDVMIFAFIAIGSIVPGGG